MTPEEQMISIVEVFEDVLGPHPEIQRAISGQIRQARREALEEAAEWHDNQPSLGTPGPIAFAHKQAAEHFRALMEKQDSLLGKED